MWSSEVRENLQNRQKEGLQRQFEVHQVVELANRSGQSRFRTSDVGTFSENVISVGLVVPVSCVLLSEQEQQHEHDRRDHRHGAAWYSNRVDWRLPSDW